MAELLRCFLTTRCDFPFHANRNHLHVRSGHVSSHGFRPSGAGASSKLSQHVCSVTAAATTCELRLLRAVLPCCYPRRHNPQLWNDPWCLRSAAARDMSVCSHRAVVAYHCTLYCQPRACIPTAPRHLQFVIELPINPICRSAVQVCTAACELGVAGVCSAAAAVCELAALIQHEAKPAGERASFLPSFMHPSFPLDS